MYLNKCKNKQEIKFNYNMLYFELKKEFCDKTSIKKKKTLTSFFSDLVLMLKNFLLEYFFVSKEIF